MAGSNSSLSSVSTLFATSLHPPTVVAPSVASIPPAPIVATSSATSLTPTTTIHPAPVTSLSRASITDFQVYFVHDGVNVPDDFVLVYIVTVSDVSASYRL